MQVTSQSPFPRGAAELCKEQKLLGLCSVWDRAVARVFQQRMVLLIQNNG